MTNKYPSLKIEVEMKNFCGENKSREMKIVCAWCHKYMGEKDGEGVEGVSHSICRECLVKLMTKVESKIREAGGQASKGTFSKQDK